MRKLIAIVVSFPHHKKGLRGCYSREKGKRKNMLTNEPQHYTHHNSFLEMSQGSLDHSFFPVRPAVKESYYQLS